MKKYLLLTIAVLTVLLCTSCMEELGTYNYVETNEIKIDSIKGQSITQYDTLCIVPTITQSKNVSEENLEYLWYWYKAGAGENAKIDTLGFDRNLKYYVAAGPGLYNARLKITDKETGLFARKEFDITVDAENSGLLILSDLNGNANLSLLNSSKIFSQNIYYAANGEYAGTHPIGIADIDNAATDLHMIVILCADGKGGVVTEPTSFVKISDYSSLFYVMPSPIAPEAYCAVATLYNTGMGITYDFVINNGKLHYRDFQYASYEPLFNPEVSGDYSLAPYAILNNNTLLFYDNKNYHFNILKCSYGQLKETKLDPVPLPEGTDTDALAFDPRNVGLELVYAAKGWKKMDNDAGYAYGIFRKPGTTDLANMYCLRFNIGYSMSMGGDYFTPYFQHTVSGATDLDKATAFAMSREDPYLYYAYKNKIYSYDLEFDKGKVIYDTDTVVGPGAKVDYLYFRPDNESFNMWAATSVEGSSERTGSIHVLGLGRNGDVIKVDTVYRNVCGKVVGMTFKNR